MNSIGLATAIGLGLALAGTTAIARADARVEARAALVKIDAALQRAVARGEAPRALDRLTREFESTAEIPGNAEWIRKRAAVRTLLDAVAAADSNATRVPGSASRAAVEATRGVYHLAVDGPGARCETALRLAIGEPLEVELPAAADLWIEVPAHDRTLAITTRGSSADTMLAGWNDCREVMRDPGVRADDTFGLQADLPLTAADHGRRVRVSTLGGASGRVSIRGIDAATISGRVVRDATLDPLSGVQVAMFLGATPEFPSYAGTAWTDGDGRYTIVSSVGIDGLRAYLRTGTGGSNNPPPLHEAWPNVPCWTDSAYNFQTCSLGVPAGVEIAPGGVYPNIDFSLGLGATLRGRVLDDVTGIGLPYASVSMRGSVPNNPFTRYEQTDAAGRFAFGTLPDMSVQLAASAFDHETEIYNDRPCPAGSSCDLATGDSITIAGAQAPTIDFRLARQSFIEVTLHSADPTTALYSRHAHALNEFGVIVATDSQNGFDNEPLRVGPLPPGTYFVRGEIESVSYATLYPDVVCATTCIGELAGGTPVTITGPGSTPRVSIDVESKPKIVGRVTDVATAAPLPNVTVDLVSPSSPTASVQSVTTDADGRYRFAGLNADTYFVHARSPRHRDQLYVDAPCESYRPMLDCTGGQALPITFRSPDRVVDLAMRASATIAGEASVDGIDAPIGYVVLLSPAGPVEIVRYLDYTYEDGAYTAFDVPAGTYRIGAGDFGHVRQVYDGVECGEVWTSCAPNAGTAVTIADGASITGIDFALRGETSRRGFVRDGDTGDPLPGIAIDLWNAAGARIGTTVSDTSGRFHVVGDSLSVSAYRVSTDNAFGYRDEVYSDVPCATGSVYLGTCTLAGATPVMLPAALGVPPLEITLTNVERIFANGFD